MRILARTGERARYPASREPDVETEAVLLSGLGNTQVGVEVDDGSTPGVVVSSWQEAEALAGWHMKKLGFDDAKLTPPGVDGGIDVTAEAAVAQVKHYATAPIGAPPVQQLRGAAISRD